MSEIKYQFEYFDEIESTHQYALQLEQSSLPKVVVANQQTGGIGQFGRKWASQPNSSLLMSICFWEVPISSLHFIPFLMGKSCHEAIESNHITLKWPNDLFLDKRKLGGILCESRFSGNTISKVVLSCGINLNDSNQFKNCAFLSELGITNSPLEIAERIVDRVIWNYFNASDQEILTYYNTYLFGTSEFLTYENPQESIHARVIKLLENGNLALSTPQNRQVIFDSPGTYKLSV